MIFLQIILLINLVSLWLAIKVDEKETKVLLSRGLERMFPWSVSDTLIGLVIGPFFLIIVAGSYCHVKVEK